MVRRIKVSRAGLTRCPGCGSHIKLSADVKDTACPFCGVILVVGLTPESFQRTLLDSARDMMIGRSGIITASLFGITTAMGCGDEAADKPPPDVIEVEDSNAEPVYGAPPDMDVVQDVVDDPPPEDVYGAPPDTKDTAEPADVQPDVPDVPALPPYGIPPEDISEPEDTADEDTADNDTADTADDKADATVDEVTTEDAGDPSPTPLYGAPPPSE